MTRNFRTSHTGTNRDAHRIGRRGDGVAQARRERSLSLVAWPNACAAAALASALVLGSPVEAVAQAAGEVFTGCELATGTVAALRTDMGPGFVADGQVAFVVVYTMKDNDGQEIADGAGAPTGTFTGPVICVNPTADGVESEFQGVDIASVNQTDTIPHPATGATAVNTLDAEEVFILRYALADGSNADVEEKVLCHAVNNIVNCFRISPLLVTESPG